MTMATPGFKHLHVSVTQVMAVCMAQAVAMKRRRTPDEVVIVVVAPSVYDGVSVVAQPVCKPMTKAVTKTMSKTIPSIMPKIVSKSKPDTMTNSRSKPKANAVTQT